MKRLLIIGAASASLWASCSDQKSKPVHAPEGMVAYDLQKFGKPFHLFVPDTAGAPLRIEEDPSGALELESRGFGVSIREQSEDLHLRKQDIESDEVNRLQKLLVDDSTALVWESKITAPEFHFIVNQRHGSSTYSFEDLRDATGAPYGKDAVMRMVDACRNIQWRESNE